MTRPFSLAMPLCAAFFVGPAPTQAPDIPPLKMVQESIPDLIIHEALRAGVAPWLALNLAWRESRLDPGVVSAQNRNGTYDWGLFGLNTRTVFVLHVARPLDAIQNTIAGVGLLRFWKQACGSDAAALWGYAHGRCPAQDYMKGRR